MRFLRTFSFVFAPVLLSGSLSSACMCLPTTKEKKFSRSRVVVVATVKAADSNSYYEYQSQEGVRRIPSVKYTFENADFFKGEAAQELEILSTRTSCFRKLEVGRQYLIYAGNENDDSPLTIVTCSRILPLEEAGEDLAYIKEQGENR